MNLAELYQQLIIDHNRKPKNFGKLDVITHEAEGFNPVCGDHYWVYLLMNDHGVCKDISFSGTGCAISKASASLMTVEIKGKKTEEIQEIFKKFHLMLTKSLTADQINSMGTLKLFGGVKKYPGRVKCALLGWHTMFAALEKEEKVASTE